MLIRNLMKNILDGHRPDDEETLRLFRIKNRDEFNELMETAFEVRRDQSRTVKLTSTVHLTNICQVTPKCGYCGFAAGTSAEGYFHPFYKSESEILEAAKKIEESGIPRVSCSGAHGYQGRQAVDAARIVKENTSLELLVNVGADLSRDSLSHILGYGTDTVCCNLETVNEVLFHAVKPGERFEDRVRSCEMISDQGVELSSGLLVGLGESYENRVAHLKFLRRFKTLGEIPIMGFNPYRGTPMQDHPPCSLDEQMKTIAITRIMYPEIRITVPTPTIGPENVKYSLLAGADNVATVIPDSYPLDIKGVGSPAFGTLNEVVRVIREMDLTPELRHLTVPVVSAKPLVPGV
ncbi:5,10-methenyltetrahydromethanopterin hydrogenase cofactor biosynthesis protein HmdB [uncultured Methanospirillum sp.]|uniref:5,10-methenyltetrahydromethanopterin hydrogenase cofactor biosynthesis protein HmdB n=1 Tax=uncultured Methanospirillum sp. TaxID=262503 RepID=UPI0029C71538|nr:5,10-methenyltetrahydromethanopterin hydrogenase cofactor biosynthesis protein HmdB [uncultured Methanospirillum sp.]